MLEPTDEYPDGRQVDQTQIVYVLDPTDGEVLQAVQCVFGRRGKIAEVIQGQYTQAQLGEWYKDRLWDTVHNIPGVTTSGISVIKNRITVGLAPRRGNRAALEAELARLGIPRAAVDINIGCERQGVEEGLETPSVQIDEQLAQSLATSLEISSIVRYGETVTMKFTVENTSEQPVRLALGGRPPFDFIVTTLEDDDVWNSLCGQIVLAVLGSATLNPGEELEFEAQWEQVDNSGIPVPPGAYSVRGVLNMEHRQKLETAATEFTIAPEGN